MTTKLGAKPELYVYSYIDVNYILNTFIVLWVNMFECISMSSMLSLYQNKNQKSSQMF